MIIDQQDTMAALVKDMIIYRKPNTLKIHLIHYTGIKSVKTDLIFQLSTLLHIQVYTAHSC